MKNSTQSNRLGTIQANLTTKSELAAIKGGNFSKNQLISTLMAQNATNQADDVSCETGNGNQGSC